MQETVTVPVRTIQVDYTLPLLAVGLVLLALVVLGLVVVLVASRRRVSSTKSDDLRNPGN